MKVSFPSKGSACIALCQYRACIPNLILSCHSLKNDVINLTPRSSECRMLCDIRWVCVYANARGEVAFFCIRVSCRWASLRKISGTDTESEELRAVIAVVFSYCNYY